jgi:signal transduction histidine kinase
LAFPALRHRFLWRLRAPADSGEIRRTERWLATARVALAISALVTIWMDPGEIRYSIWAYGLLGFYIIHSVVIMLLLRFRQRSTFAFRLLVHGADIVWPALISAFATNSRNPFFLFFVFVMAAAAYRWGLLETMTTAVAALLLLWAESLAMNLGFLSWADHALARHHLPILLINVADFEPKALFMRSIYLLVLGLLLGYLAGQQKQLRAEKSVIARTLGLARVEVGMTGTLQDILGDVLAMYGAKQAVIASLEAASHHVFVGEVRALSGTRTAFHWLEATPADREAYLYDSPADVCYIRRARRGSESYIALNQEGLRIRDLNTDFVPLLAQRHEFRDLIVGSFVFGREWSGRIFLLDPDLSGELEEELRFLQELIRQVGPAVYNVYLLRRLRRRAGALERARFARELHDGAVQSLISVEMQLDVLRRRSASHPAVVTDELGRIQGLLREEVLKLRELMQQMKSLDVDSKKLLALLRDTVERFQRETGISARFISELDELDMPQQVCRELARIVQEGLVNVRKHSHAKQALVRLGANNGNWTVIIEDNGSGFPFTGRVSHNDLDAMGKGPVVIKERVRLIAGELTIESNPGRGARLEISIPQKREAAYGE